MKRRRESAEFFAAMFPPFEMIGGSVPACVRIGGPASLLQCAGTAYNPGLLRVHIMLRAAGEQSTGPAREDFHMLRKRGEKLPDGRWQAAPAERNKGAILDVLQRMLPRSGLVLEVASGTGQHVVHFARALPALIWQPSDADPDLRRSVALWIEHEGLPNVREPLPLDVREPRWPLARADALVCINMIHVTPQAATAALFRGAAAILPAGGTVFLYGPYRRFGRHTAPSNEEFDAQLRAQDPEWGLRNVEDVERAARREGIALVATIAMPSNNFSLLFSKAA
jgi:SAM-dependent methyltransferase